MTVDSIAEAIELMGGESGLVDFINVRLAELTEQPLDEPDKPQEEPDVMDRSASGGREIVARGMLDQYHLLRTNLATRTAIYNVLSRRNATSQGTLSAYAQMEDAKQELESAILTILELMGVDS